MFHELAARVGWLGRWRAAAGREAGRRELAGLSDGTLRDLGLRRCELSSVVAEVEGRVERTRTRLVPERQ